MFKKNIKYKPYHYFMKKLLICVILFFNNIQIKPIKIKLKIWLFEGYKANLVYIKQFLLETIHKLFIYIAFKL